MIDYEELIMQDNDEQEKFYKSWARLLEKNGTKAKD